MVSKSWEKKVISLFDKEKSYLFLDIKRKDKLNDQGTQGIMNGLSKISYDILSLNATFGFSQFKIKGCQNIGLGIGQCVKLQELTIDLGLNKIKAEGISKLFNGISQCSQLQSLNLIIFKNEINPEGGQFLGNSISKLQCLQKLNLQITYDNNLQSQGFKGICEGISQCKNLQVLHLQVYQNGIKSDGLNGFKAIFQRIEQLKEFKLYWLQNQIDKEGAQLIGEGFKSQQSLQNVTLSFGRHALQDNEWFIILQGLSKCSSLEDLVINSMAERDELNRFSQQGFQGLQQILVQCKNLVKLNLFLCCMTVDWQSSLYLAEGLKSTEKLQQLCLNFEAQEDPYAIYANIPPAISTLESLKIIKLSVCLYHDRDPRVNPEAFTYISKIKNLQVLDFSYIQLVSIFDSNYFILKDSILNLLNLNTLKLNFSYSMLSYHKILDLAQALSENKSLTTLSVNLPKDFQDSSNFLKIKKIILFSKRLINLKLLVLHMPKLSI